LSLSLLTSIQYFYNLTIHGLGILHITSMAWAYKYHLLTCFGILVALVLALVVQVTFFSPSFGPAANEFRNGKIQEVIKLGEGLLKQPEDVAVDKNGVLYTATRDGFIKRMHKNGTWENWRRLDSDGLLGVTVTAAGDIVVCDANKGPLKIDEKGVKVLALHGFADDVVEASDGSLYYSVASTKYGLHNWHLDVLEAKPHGQLLKYDPSSNATYVVLDGLGFANGVALSADQDYLVICESWKHTCLKYWLDGDKKGKTEIFIDNLPGAPDNINLAPDGSFWIALLELHSRRLEFLYKWRSLRYLIESHHELGKWMARLRKKAMVVNVDRNGKIIRGFDDPTGKVMEFVTSALEFEGHLYLGSLRNDFIGKLPLPTPPV
ncbi:adipocyte plasma membrane-associated protein, partial [Striga asiatica]